MLNHGVSTGGLFLLVGMIYERTHSREVSKYGGLAKVLPLFAIMFFLITISSIAVPGTNGFIGEFLILLGTFEINKVAAVIAVTGVIWGAVYMLWLYKRVFFGKAGELTSHSDHGHPLKDLSLREISVLVPLLIFVFWMGLFPNHFLNKTKASLDYFVENRAHYELTVQESQTLLPVARK
jgi:NADH-quinone oxidoreductase subunit M